MTFAPLRAALYSALALFSIILLSLTAARVAHTRSQRFSDPIHSGNRGFYEPTTVELLSTSIFSLLWAVPFMFLLCRPRRNRMIHWLTELIGLFILFVLYLVGAAIFTHKYQRVSNCRGFFRQCRIVSSIMAFSWINWAITFFLLLATLFAWLHSRNTHPTAENNNGPAMAATAHHNNTYPPNANYTTGTTGVGQTGAGATGTAYGAENRAGHNVDHIGSGYNDGTPGYGTGTTSSGPEYSQPQTRAVQETDPISTGHQPTTAV